MGRLLSGIVQDLVLAYIGLTSQNHSRTRRVVFTVEVIKGCEVYFAYGKSCLGAHKWNGSPKFAGRFLRNTFPKCCDYRVVDIREGMNNTCIFPNYRFEG
jgi:hypothetical protein